MDFQNNLGNFVSKVQVMLHDFDIELKKENIHMDEGNMKKMLKKRLGNISVR